MLTEADPYTTTSRLLKASVILNHRKTIAEGLLINATVNDGKPYSILSL